MARKTSAESEEVRLKKKIAQMRAGGITPERAAAFRALRKRLKRVQRRRRALALRSQHAVRSKGTVSPAAT